MERDAGGSLRKLILSRSMSPRSIPGRLSRAWRVAVLATFATVAMSAMPAPSWSQPRSAAIRERLKTRPNDPILHYYLAAAEIAEGDRGAGFEALAKVAEIGKGFLPPRGFGFDSVWEDTTFQRIRGTLESKLPKVTEAREIFRLEKGLIPEGIAHDPATQNYFVGSIAAAKIVRIDSRGEVSDFSKPGELSQVLGLAVDARSRRLHAVSTTLVSGALKTNQVVSYDLDRGVRVRSIEIPAATQLNDVTVASNGDLYVSDTPGGAVFRLRGEAGVVDTLVAPGTLPGANGIAVSPNGSVLYVAHATGVSRLELETRALLPRLEVPEGETIGAIDGLYADGNTLIGIQNVTNPGRVIRIRLRADGRGTERIETLLSHHHAAIDEPTTGVVVGRSFAFLATTQVARFTPEGKIDSPPSLKPPVVLRISLGPKRS